MNWLSEFLLTGFLFIKIFFLILIFSTLKMNLQGKKSDGTDMHSMTASMIGISRDHAKV